MELSKIRHLKRIDGVQSARQFVNIIIDNKLHNFCFKKKYSGFP